MDMCRMGDVCLPGLQGFPVQITGWSSIDKINYTIPNDIQLQFSPSESPMKFDEDSLVFQPHGSNTFFMGGSQYKVYAVRLSAPKQEGLKVFSGNPVAELQIWGYNENTINLAVLTIPYYLNPKTNEQSDALLNILWGKAVKLIDVIPDGSGVEIVRYSTCIEISSKQMPTINIQVAYWSTGVPISQETFNFLLKGIDTIKPGIPQLFDLKVLTSFTQLNDEKRSKTDRKYEIGKGILFPYQNSVAISVASKEIQNGFRIITNFNKGKQTPTRKWIPIDPEKDIKNGYLLINPESGERLDVENIPEEAKKNPEVNIPPPPPVGNIWRTICILLGVLLGCLIVYGVYATIGTYILDRKTQNLPPLDPITSKLQSTLPEGLVGK